MLNVCEVPWRVGRSVGRTIYAMVGDEPDSEDILIGLMDDPTIADEVCKAHNMHLAQERTHM